LLDPVGIEPYVAAPQRKTPVRRRAPITYDAIGPGKQSNLLLLHAHGREEHSTMIKPIKITAWSHICIRVSDLERSLGFYRDVLGLEVLAQMAIGGDPLERALGGQKGATGRTVFGRIGGQHVEIMQLNDVPVEDGIVSSLKAIRPYPIYGVGTFTFRVPDLSIAYEDCLARGIAVESPPIDIDGVRLFFINDPDGVRIELLELPERHFATLADSDAGETRAIP
jgi:glyoxylase I family protein